MTAKLNEGVSVTGTAGRRRSIQKHSKTLWVLVFELSLEPIGRMQIIASVTLNQRSLTFGTVRTQEASEAVAVSSHTLSVSIAVC